MSVGRLWEPNRLRSPPPQLRHTPGVSDHPGNLILALVSSRSGDAVFEGAELSRRNAVAVTRPERIREVFSGPSDVFYAYEINKIMFSVVGDNSPGHPARSTPTRPAPRCTADRHTEDDRRVRARAADLRANVRRVPRHPVLLPAVHLLLGQEPVR